MKKIFVFVAALFVTFGLSAQQSKMGEVVVNGYAERMITPDKFVLGITIDEEDSKGRLSFEEQERDMRKALKGAGFDVEESLRLKDNFSSYHRRGAYATRSYELTLFGADKLTLAFEVLESLNVNNVWLKSAICTNLDKIREELRKEAILNAKQTAITLAEALGQSIGACTYISDYNTSGDMEFRAYKNQLRAVRENAVETDYIVSEPVEYADEKLTHYLQAHFKLLE